MGRIPTPCSIIDDPEIKKIATTIQAYHVAFKDMAESPIGKYTVPQMLEHVEEGLNYIEIYTPTLRDWAETYLAENRGPLWLYDGIRAGTKLVGYWEISKTNLPMLKSAWPFLYDRTEPKYNHFAVDLVAAQYEVLRQRERDKTNNPKYTPFHPGGCPSSGCCCWMLDDMEQWHEEEQAEVKASDNIFFNPDLQGDFYKMVCEEELDSLHTQWGQYRPERPAPKTYDAEFKDITGQTQIHIIRSWLKSDFKWGPFGMFDWNAKFHEVWETVESIDGFVSVQRQKLKTILELV
jgi:hypothetical protein